MVQQKTSIIRQRVTLPASLQAVYRALTEARATGAARIGAAFTAWDGYISGKHIELIPAQRIVQQWQTREWPAGYAPSVLDIRLVASDGGTLLHLTHKNIPARHAADLRAGWID